MSSCILTARCSADIQRRQRDAIERAETAEQDERKAKEIKRLVVGGVIS
jgi:hypothetical protein